MCNIAPSGEWLAVSSENNLWLLATDPESVLKKRQLDEHKSPFEIENQETCLQSQLHATGRAHPGK